jgi:hypothetical protein
METLEQIETYIVPYNCMYSLPIRMPGITLRISSTTPTFQVTLKGGCDENGIFEISQNPGTWDITALDYALGRLAYDIIWEEGLTAQTPVSIKTYYSTISPKSECKSDDMPQQLIIKQWSLDVIPTRWLALPKSKNLLKKIQVKWQEKREFDTPPQCEFKLAVATIPLKIFPVSSSHGILDLTTIQSPILADGKLNFSQIFNLWIVFDSDVDWSQWTPSVTYWVESN